MPRLGSRLDLDATGKWPGESDRILGWPIAITRKVSARAGALRNELDIA